MIPLVGLSTYVAESAWGAWSRPAAVLPESYYELVASAGGPTHAPAAAADRRVAGPGSAQPR